MPWQTQMFAGGGHDACATRRPTIARRSGRIDFDAIYISIFIPFFKCQSKFEIWMASKSITKFEMNYGLYMSVKFETKTGLKM